MALCSRCYGRGKVGKLYNTAYPDGYRDCPECGGTGNAGRSGGSSGPSGSGGFVNFLFSVTLVAIVIGYLIYHRDQLGGVGDRLSGFVEGIRDRWT
jgi:hypothetical protein